MNTDQALQSRRPSSSLLARMRVATAAVLEQERAARRAQSIEVASFAGRRIAVTGAVRRPVVFMWDEGVTVADAIAIARGPRDDADRAVILRRTAEGVLEIQVDLRASEASTLRLARGDEVRVLA